LDRAFSSLFEPETYPETKALLELLTDSVKNSQAVTEARYKQVKTDIRNFIRHNHQASDALKAGMEYLPDIAAFMAGIKDKFPLTIPDECQTAEEEIDREIEALKEPETLDKALKSLFEPETEGLYELLDDSVRNPSTVTSERVAQIKTRINNAIKNQDKPSAQLKAQALLPDVAGYIAGIQDEFPVLLPTGIDEKLAEIERQEGANLKTADEWNGLGVRFFNEKRSIEEETACYKKALSIDKKYVCGWSNLGTIDNRRNEYALATPFSFTAIILDANHSPAWHQLDDQYNSLNAPLPAIKTISMSSIFFDESRFNTWNRLASVYGAKEPFHRITCALKALDKNSQSQRSWGHLAKAYRWLDTEYELIVAFDLTALTVNSNYRFDWNSLAWIYQSKIKSLGRGKLCSIITLIYDEKNHLKWNRVAFDYLGFKKYNHAMACCQHSQSLNRQYQLSWERLAKVYRNGLTASSPARLCLMIGLVLVKKGNGWSWDMLNAIFVEEIIDYKLSKICAYYSLIERDSSSAWTGLGNSFHELYNYSQAILAYTLSLLINPENSVPWSIIGNSVPWSNIGNDENKLKKTNLAISCCKVSISFNLNKYKEYTLRDIASCYHSFKKSPHAIACSLAALVEDLKLSSVWENLDFYYRRADKIRLAFYSTREALHAIPQKPSFWTDFIERLYSNNRYEEAKAATYFRELVFHKAMRAFFELQPLLESIHSEESFAPVEIDIDDLFTGLYKDIKSDETKWPHPSDKPIAIELYNQYRFRWLHFKLKFDLPEKPEEVEALCMEMLWCRLLAFIDSLPPQNACFDAIAFLKIIKCLPPANLAPWRDVHEAVEGDEDDETGADLLTDGEVITFHENLEPDEFLNKHKGLADPIIDWISARPEQSLHIDLDDTKILERRLNALERARQSLNAIDAKGLLPPGKAKLTERIGSLQNAIRKSKYKDYFAQKGEIVFEPRAMQGRYNRADDSQVIHKRFETIFNEALKNQLDNIGHSHLKQIILTQGTATVCKSGDQLLLKRFEDFWKKLEEEIYSLDKLNLPEFKRESGQIAIIKEKSEHKETFDWPESADYQTDKENFKTIIDQWICLCDHEHAELWCNPEDDPLWQIRDRLVQRIEKFKNELKNTGETAKQLKEVLNKGAEEVNKRIQWKKEAFKDEIPFDVLVQYCLDYVGLDEKKLKIDPSMSEKWLKLPSETADKLRYILINEMNNISKYSGGEEIFQLTFKGTNNCFHWRNRIATKADKVQIKKRLKIIKEQDYTDPAHRKKIDAKIKAKKTGTGTYRFLQFKAELAEQGYNVKLDGSPKDQYYYGDIRLDERKAAQATQPSGKQSGLQNFFKRIFRNQTKRSQQ